GLTTRGFDSSVGPATCLRLDTLRFCARALQFLRLDLFTLDGFRKFRAEIDRTHQQPGQLNAFPLEAGSDAFLYGSLYIGAVFAVNPFSLILRHHDTHQV